MTRPLPRIDALSDGQRQQLVDWLSTFTLDQCVELVKEKFGSEICRSTLNRFRKRCEHTAYLDTSPDSARARAEIINAASSGKPNFSQATVDLLEKEAFELAHDTRDPEAVRALKDLFGLVLKYENTSVRKRMATVQEGKLKLRQQQFDIANNHDTDAKIQDLNKKIAQAFDQHPVLTAIRNAEESSIPSDPNPNPNPSTDRKSLSETFSKTLSNPPSSATYPKFTVKNPSPTTTTPSVAPFSPAAPKRSEGGLPSLPPVEKPKPLEHHSNPLTQQAQDHLRRRWRELRYIKPWDPDYAAALARAGIPFTALNPNPNLNPPPTPDTQHQRDPLCRGAAHS
jgi:hypothetical protein